MPPPSVEGRTPQFLAVQNRSRNDGAWSRRLILALVIVLAPLLLVLIGALVVAVGYLLSS